MSTSAFERDENELNPITAGIGYNDGANKGFWRVQPRQKTGKEKGQWIEMGAELRAYFKDALGNAAAVSGRALGSDGTPDGVRVYISGYADKGIPDGVYGFNTKHVRVASAVLPEGYIESKGLSANEIPSDIDMADLPNIGDLERADVTPDDIRMANDGIDSPEGQEMAAFKNSPEGQEIARLDEATAKGVQQGFEPEFRPYDGSGRPKPQETGRLTLPEGFETDQIPEEAEQMRAMMDGSFYDGRMSFEDKVRIARAIAAKNGGVSIYDLSDEELMDMEKLGKNTPTAMRARGEMARRGLIPEYRNLKGSKDGKDVDFGKTVPPIDRNLDAEIAKAEADVANMPEGSASDAAFDAAYAKIDRLKAERDRRANSTGTQAPAAKEIRSESKAADIVSRAMDGEDIDIDQELDEFLADPDEVDVEDINVGPTGKSKVTDPEFDMEPVAKSAISADEVAIDDFLDDDNDEVFKVTSVDVDEDGNWEIFGVDRDGDEVSMFGGRSDRVRRIDEFDEPGNAPVTVPATPANVTPAAKPKAEMPEEAARLDSVWNTKPGDVLYDRNGNKLGTVESVSKSGSYANPNKSAEVVLLGDDGSKSKKMIMDSQALSRVAAPEPEAPEAPALNADEPKANAAGFTKALRYSLRGMKGDRNKDRQAYARALANGRTSTILQDDDGTWFLEKHDEFNGGIKEVKQFDSLDEALAEGTNFLQNKDPKFDAPEKPEAAPAPAPAAGPSSKKAEALAAGDQLMGADGSPFGPGAGTVDSVEVSNGRVTVNYTDGNGDKKTKLFREGKDVDLDNGQDLEPRDIVSQSDDKGGKKASKADLDKIAELDTRDAENNIPDEDLRDELFDMINRIADGDTPTSAEARDLIKRIEDAYGPDAEEPGDDDEGDGGLDEEEIPLEETPEFADRRTDDGQNKANAPVRTVAEMRKTKLKNLLDKFGKRHYVVGPDGKKVNPSDPSQVLSQLAADYPDGHFIDNTADELHNAYMTHRADIDGGARKLEMGVIRSTNNQYLVFARVTDKATGEVKTYYSHDARDTYTSIHGLTNGLERLFGHFSGATSPIKNMNTPEGRKFRPGSSFENRITYWRKREKDYTDENKLTDAELETLDKVYDGDVDAFNAAKSLEDFRVLTLEERVNLTANGEAERLEEVVDVNLGRVLRKQVASFYEAFEANDRVSARQRYNAMLSLLPDNEASRAMVRKVVRAELTRRLEMEGLEGQERASAIKRISGFTTAFSHFANKQFSLDNELRIPYANGEGIKVVKKGDLVVAKDNMQRDVVVRVYGLLKGSGKNQNDDFVRVVAVNPKTGKLEALPSDIAAKSLRALSDGENPEIGEWQGWDRMLTMTEARLGPEAARRRAIALGIKYNGPDDPDGPGGAGADDDDIPPGGGGASSKPAAALQDGDEVFGADGLPLGTVTKVVFREVNGEPMALVQYRTPDGKTGRVAYSPDQLVGAPDTPKA